MSNRKGLVSAAACAVLAMAGLVRADEATVPSSLTPYVIMAEAPARRPLMALLGDAATPLEDAGITIGGRVEGSYTYSFSSPPGNDISGRLFDFENQDLTLNQVGFFVDKQVKSDVFDIGGRMEWIYGADSRFIHSLGLFDHMNVDSGPDNQWDLNQLYVDLNIPNFAKLRVGKFVTPIGYEVIDPTANSLYSHSYMFNYAIPFTHTGVTATFALNEKASLMVGVTRGWDTSLEDDNDTVDFLGQLSYAMPDANIYLTVITGADQPGDNDNWRTLVDFIYTRKIGDNVTVALNADYAYEANSGSSVSGSDAQWFGVAAYLGVKMADTVTLNTRIEYFNDQDGARVTGGVGGTSLYEATAGLSIRPFAHDAIGQHFVIRPEIRFDYSEKKFFDGATDRYQLTAAVDAIFSF
jgi:hypothetical protein